MKQARIFIIMAFTAGIANAQTTYTDFLRKKEKGEGAVIIVQSDEIERLVNNSQPQSTNQHPDRMSKKSTSVQVQPASGNDNEDKNESSPGQMVRPVSKETGSRASATGHYAERIRRKARGFRICIFTGGNSRKDKEQAYKMAQICRDSFKELAVYPSFESPRWVTHVGDFRTRQEAQKYVKLIRSARFTYEVRIVASEVNLPL